MSTDRFKGSARPSIADELKLMGWDEMSLVCLHRGTYGPTLMGRRGDEGLLVVKVVDYYSRKSEKTRDKVCRMVQQVIPIWSTFVHRFLVPLYDCTELRGRAYQVMLYYGNGSIDEWIAKDSPPDRDQTLKCLRQIYSGVSYLHGRGLAHRYLRLQNIFVDNNEDIHIGGFKYLSQVAGDGLIDSHVHITSFSSPEQVQRVPHNAYRSDVWNVGIITYSILSSGSLPFNYDSDSDKGQENLLRDMRLLNVNWAKVNMYENAEQDIRLMLSFDPIHRPSMNDLQALSWLNTS